MPNRIVMVLVALSSLQTAVGGAWSNWRGPNSDGSVTDGLEYPRQWDEQTNVRWKIELPGPGSSTPVVWDDRLVITHGIDEENAVSAFDLDGNKLWTTKIGAYRPAKHKKGTGCNPSPVTDGKHVFVYFKSGDLAALDWDGSVLWQTNLQDEFGEDTLWWDLGTSPVLTENYVVVACVQSGPSYLVAFDKVSGDLAWKKDRLLNAPEEANQSYSTPIVTRYRGAEILIVLGADHLTAHSTDDGSELWRVGDFNPEREKFFRSIASATLIDEVVVTPYARGSTLTGVRLGGTGDVTDSHVAWRREADSSDVPTPANLGGMAIVCTDKGKVLAVDVVTGGEVWSTVLPHGRDAFSSSPVAVNGKIYVTREDGTTFVLDKQGQLQSTNQLDCYVVATPVFVGGNIFVRGRDRIYCISHATTR